MAETFIIMVWGTRKVKYKQLDPVRELDIFTTKIPEH